MTKQIEDHVMQVGRMSQHLDALADDLEEFCRALKFTGQNEMALRLERWVSSQRGVAHALQVAHGGILDYIVQKV